MLSRTARRPPPAVKALIFDFDGLILDTETPEYEAWAEVYAEHGCELPLSLWVDSIGRGHEQLKFDPYSYLSEELGKPIDCDEIRARRRLRFHDKIAKLKPRPGILDYLYSADARGIRCAVASSSHRDWVEGHLARLGILNRFAFTRCADDVRNTKPAPDVYLAAVSGLDVGVDEAVAFEDSPNGVRAALSAGIFTVAVPNPLTARLSFDHADRSIESMSAIALDALLELP